MRTLFAGGRGDQCIIFWDQGSTDPPGGLYDEIVDMFWGLPQNWTIFYFFIFFFFGWGGGGSVIYMFGLFLLVQGAELEYIIGVAKFQIFLRYAWYS